MEGQQQMSAQPVGAEEQVPNWEKVRASVSDFSMSLFWIAWYQMQFCLTTVFNWPLCLCFAQIKSVQGMIERCMQQYMTQAEIIATLQSQADIQPSLTCLVWQKLEEQNQDFFYSYNVMLRVTDQMVSFNYLVDQQTRLLHKLSLSLKPPARNGASSEE